MTTWLNLLAIGTGGFFGAICRYGITVGSMAIPGGSSMLGTTIANLVGCAAIGGLIEFSGAGGAIDGRLRLAIQAGFLGSLTTFSTFAAESASLGLDGRTAMAAIYLAANLLLGWAVLLGTAEIVKGWTA